MMPRISPQAHSELPWRIHQLAPDFEVEDVWDFPVPAAGAHDFARVLEAVRSQGGPESYNLATRALWSLRWKLGALLRIDDGQHGTGARVESVRDRLPADLAAATQPAQGSSVPMTPVYRTADESVSEIANRTMHGLMHLGWVKRDDGYHLQMAVLVKANGPLGRLYMNFIKPFRYLVVYPSLTRTWSRLIRAAVPPR